MAKKFKFKKVLACIMATLMLGSAVSISAFATEDAAGTIDGLKPIGYFEQTDLGPRFKYYDNSMLVSESDLQSNVSLPEKYDLRDVNGKSYVTSVKHQGYTGSCWAFSSISSLESNMIKQGNADADSLDLSERHLAWYVYRGENYSNDRSEYAGEDTFIGIDWETYSTECSEEEIETYTRICAENGISLDEFALYSSGGNADETMATLARGYGVVDESELPFESVTYEGKEYIGIMGAPESDLQTESNIALAKANHLPETYNDEGEYQEQAVATIKEAIMNNGAVDMSYYADDGQEYSTSSNYWNQENYSYYASEMWDPNHEVNIIGWDDSYSADNFATKPDGDGAWIIKNSWGTDWADDGYFYLSYYDKTVCEPTSFIAENHKYNGKATEQDYDNVYQYDGVGLYAFNSINTTSSANVFTARSDEYLQAFSFGNGGADSTCKVEVYLNPTNDDPTSGTLAYSGSQIFERVGQQRFDMGDDKVYLPSGTKYSVVITESYKYDGQDTYLTLNEAGIEDYCTVQPCLGESYLYIDGRWIDVASDDEELKDICEWHGVTNFGGAKIKALTNDADEPTPVKNGWQNENGQWKYYNNNVAVTGWQQLPWSGGTDWFYFDANGVMQVGWQSQIAGWEGQWFFFDGTTGAMKTGWHLLPWSLGTNWFDFRSNGTMYANCTTPDGYRVDANGVWVH